VLFVSTFAAADAVPWVSCGINVPPPVIRTIPSIIKSDVVAVVADCSGTELEENPAITAMATLVIEVPAIEPIVAVPPKV
jgi:hypothetical protein